MNPDIPSLRAELKSFERDFKARHDRVPSVDDIKKAGFADKYKLYKRLSKLGSATRSLPENAIVPPSTPPRSVPPKSESIIPRSRAVKTETASGFNPFSPVKNKQKHAAPFPLSGPGGSANPHATPPPKAKQALLSSPNALSPDLSPPIQNFADITCPPQKALQNNTVSRARKRLRGEPVSPSPVKDKRRRILPDALTFPKLSTLTAEDSDNDDQAAEQADSSFLADSPMKPTPTKRGAFKLLFEGGAGDVTTQGRRIRSPMDPVDAGHGLFGSKSQRERSMSRSSGSETPSDNHHTLKMKSSEGNPTKDSTMSRTAKRLYPHRFGKNDLFGAAEPSETSPSETRQAVQTGHMESPRGTTAAKRSLADTESDAPDPLYPNHRPALLPPSPPLASSSSSAYTSTGKGKAKGPIRKRSKLPEDSGDEDEGSTDLHVTVREWSWQRRETSRATELSAEELDHVLDLSAHDRPSSPGPANEDTPDDFEVNLPDDLRRLLAISPSKVHTTRDVSMVRGVLYGKRTSSYDARRGGDIWDVGEIGEASDSQAEDDWEGEPVPWETGEL
ncbi:hypothetical protein BJV78DRAFT_1290956 [Lactifluus subvellereus]|nr:hypothetical protein BJV78DRAFT_1290956 [Lactifluus subvellereus]